MSLENAPEVACAKYLSSSCYQTIMPWVYIHHPSSSSSSSSSIRRVTSSRWRFSFGNLHKNVLVSVSCRWLLFYNERSAVTKTRQQDEQKSLNYIILLWRFPKENLHLELVTRLDDDVVDSCHSFCEGFRRKTFTLNSWLVCLSVCSLSVCHQAPLFSGRR